MEKVSRGSQSLRPATPEDLNSLARIEGVSNKSPWTRANFEAELSKSFSRSLVLTDDETDEVIYGYIVFWLLPLDKVARILNVVVPEEYRGNGFGKRLVRQATNEALRSDYEKIQLEVRKSNESAVRLYQTLQFSIIRIHKGFYGDGEDAYIMELTLEGLPLDF